MLRRALLLLLAAASGYLALALALIASQPPVALPKGATMVFPDSTPDVEPVPLTACKARDGAPLGLRHFPARVPDAALLVLIHGSGWHGGGYVARAQALAVDDRIEVLLPDLRGHGPAPERRGDIDHIGQFEDDLADIIGQFRRPGQRLILAGHSSGGGLVLRFVGRQYGELPDGVVLMAPFLKYNAPTMRPNSGGWADALTRRSIGLTMLNAIGICGLNHRTAIQFNFPDAVLQGPQGATATKACSFRLNAAFAPRSDYKADIRRLPPFLLLAGTRNEAFRTEEFEPLLSALNPNGQYHLLDGVTHLQRFAVNLNQIDCKPRQARRCVCCVLHLIR